LVSCKEQSSSSISIVDHIKTTNHLHSRTIKASSSPGEVFANTVTVPTHPAKARGEGATSVVITTGAVDRRRITTAFFCGIGTTRHDIIHRADQSFVERLVNVDLGFAVARLVRVSRSVGRADLHHKGGRVVAVVVVDVDLVVVVVVRRRGNGTTAGPGKDESREEERDDVVSDFHDDADDGIVVADVADDDRSDFVRSNSNCERRVRLKNSKAFANHIKEMCSAPGTTTGGGHWEKVPFVPLARPPVAWKV
jgi:hypothetical protein